MELEGYLSRIEERLVKHFDLERSKEIQGYKFDLFAEYKVINQRTFLTKQDVVDKYENFEYIFVKQIIDAELDKINEFTNKLLEISNQLIKPGRFHMSTFITGVIISNNPSQEIQQFIKKYKFKKRYMFYLHGWSEIRLLLVDASTNSIFFNKAGKGVKKVFETPNK